MRREWEGLVGEMRSVDSKYVGTSIFRAPPSSVYGPPPSVSIPPLCVLILVPPLRCFLPRTYACLPVPTLSPILRVHCPPFECVRCGCGWKGNSSYAASVNAGNRITATSGKQDYAYFIPQPHPLQNNPPIFKREEMQGERDHGAMILERRSEET